MENLLEDPIYIVIAVLMIIVLYTIIKPGRKQ
jgi:hypothetical protein